jgi:Tol biopolymer transport system component
VRRAAKAAFGGALLLGAVLAAPAPASLEAQAPAPGARGQQNPLPLPSPRHAALEVTRGTWMSLDVSPDGSTLVFDLLGDLYTLPMEGGTATRITEGMAFDAQPRFSPDGESVVFISDRSGGDNVWIMRLDFTDTIQVTQGNFALYISPEWMPDGEHVIVSRAGSLLGGAAKLQMHHVERRSPMPIIRTPAALKTLGGAPTPDGRYIWYAAATGDWQYNALFPRYRLFRYDRDTGASTVMTSRYGSAFRPRVSPDGRWLTYGTRHETGTGLRIRDLETGDERWLAYPIQRDDIESRGNLDVLPGYAFTPDSRAVVLSYGGEIWRVPLNGADPERIPFRVEERRAVGPEVKFSYRVEVSDSVTARQIRNPAPAPDGRRVAFTAFDRLWIHDVETGASRRVTDHDVGEFHPTWSPDGVWVAWVTWSDRDGGHIMRARADGRGAPERLTRRAALYYNPAWSPDGARIVVSRGAARELRQAPDIFFGPQGGQFVWVPAAGGEATVIAPLGGLDVAHFRRDEPGRIYAHGPGRGLVSFRWDGTDEKGHLQVRGAPTPGGGTPHPGEPEFLPRRPYMVTATGEGDWLTPPASAAAAPLQSGPQAPLASASAALQTGPQAPPASLIMISPSGGRALALVGRQIYVVDIPEVGGPTPTVSVANPAAGPVPVRQLTDIGGEFPVWDPDGDRIHWAMGRAVATYDLTAVGAIEDEIRAERRETALAALRVRAIVDSLKTTRARVDSLKKAELEVPDSVTARLNRLLGDSVQIRADSIIRAADRARARAEAIRIHADSVRAGLDTVRADTVRYRPAERTIEVRMARDIPRGTVVLRGGRVVTMVDDQIIENADVVVTDNRIVAVGPTGEVDVPDGARIMDVSGRTITPGFVDVHYHAQWLVPEIHTEQAWQYLSNLAYGVTTTRDPQTGTTDILSYGDRVEVGGMLGPRIFSTGPGFFLGENVQSQDDARRALRRYSDYWGTRTLKMYMSGNRQQRQWIIHAARELEIMPTTEGGLDYKLNVTHAIDGYPGIEHNLPITPIYEDVVQLFKASQTTNAPTLLVSYGGPFGENFFYTTEDVQGNEKLKRFMPRESLDRRTRRRGPGAGGSPGQAGWFLEEEHVFPRHAEFIRDLVEGGARAAVGSHGQLQGLGYHWELWAMAAGGLSNHDALRVATRFGAEAIGFGRDLGTIEEGKLADLIVFDADPLDDLRNTVAIRYVMKNGRIHEGETLDEIWPRERAFPTPPWRDLGPEGVRAGVR